MKRHLPGVIRDPFKLQLVHIAKSKNQPFWSWQPTYTAHSAQIWRIFLPVYHRPSKKAGFFIFQYVRDEAWMGSEWPQIGGVSCSFFLMKHTFQWRVVRESIWSQSYSKIRTSFNAKNHHQNQRHFGAPSIDFSWHIRISGLPDSLGNIFIKWKIFLNLFQKNLFLQKINIWLRYCPTKMAASRATKSYFESFRFYYLNGFIFDKKNLKIYWITPR